MSVARQSIFLQHLSDYHVDESVFADKVVLITGAGNGIGRAMTLNFAKNGMTVIMLDKEEDALNALYDEVMEKGYTQPVIFHADLNNLTQEEVTALVKQTEESFDRLDAIIFCAAHYGNNAPIEHYSLEDWNKAMKVNLFAAFLIIQQFLPLLRKSAHGSIIISTSRQARQASAYWGAIGIAERGLQGLVQILAEETEDESLSVFSIDPGEVKTRYMQINYPGRVIDNLPKPESVIPAYQFLLFALRNSGRVSGSHYYVQHGDLYGYV